MIDSGGDPARIFEGGRRLMESDNVGLREYGLRAVDFAATRGLAAAQIEIGRLSDPRHFRAGRGDLDRPNPAVAAQQYRRAAQGGSAEARVELQGLCASLAQPLTVVDPESQLREENRLRAVDQYCK